MRFSVVFCIGTLGPNWFCRFVEKYQRTEQRPFKKIDISYTEITNPIVPKNQLLCSQMLPNSLLSEMNRFRTKALFYTEAFCITPSELRD